MANRRYAAVFDESVLASSAPETGVCAKLPSENNKHRHFSILQFELGPEGNPLNITVTPGYHSADARECIQELSKNGTTWFQTEEKTAARVEDWKEPRVLTLKRETSGDTASSQPWFYLDIRPDKDSDVIFKSVSQYNDSNEGYIRARADLVKSASDLNIPYFDFIEQQVTRSGGK